MKGTVKRERIDEAGILHSTTVGYVARLELTLEADLGLNHDDGKRLIRRIQVEVAHTWNIATAHRNTISLRHRGEEVLLAALRTRGVSSVAACAIDDRFCRVGCNCGSSKYPGAIREEAVRLISPASAANRRILGATFNRRAASERLSQGSAPS